ncbi:MAG: hypothetical protein IT324_08120 [Anaerolineae bacterium]|nr:hypothetical protein [Anaerolineae bacterium]
MLEAGVWTPTGRLYGEYDAFCYVNEVAKLSALNFSRDLGARYGLKLERRKMQGMVTRGIQGIRLRRTNE